MRSSWTVLLFPFALLACSEAGDSEPSSPAPAPSADQPPAVDPAVAECDDVLATVSPAVDAALAKAKTTDATVGIRTAKCAFVGYTSGPSKLAPDALYRIASITKTYTAAVILHFVDSGAIALDDTIAKYAFGLPNEDTITIRELLDHTSGLFNYTEDPSFGRHLDWTPTERLAVSAKNPVYFPPGTDFHYSNTNFVVLGMIAEKLGGAPIASLIRSIVLEPHGLGATFFDSGEDVKGTIAPSFLTDGTELTPIEEGRFGAWADGAIVTTSADLTKWIRTYASGEATPGQKTDLLKGVPEGLHGTETYGLALEIVKPTANGDGAAYGHGGDVPTFHSQAFYFPDKDWTVTAIVNNQDGDPSVILKAVTAALRQAKK